MCVCVCVCVGQGGRRRSRNGKENRPMEVMADELALTEVKKDVEVIGEGGGGIYYYYYYYYLLQYMQHNRAGGGGGVGKCDISEAQVNIETQSVRGTILSCERSISAVCLSQ